MPTADQRRGGRWGKLSEIRALGDNGVAAHARHLVYVHLTPGTKYHHDPNCRFAADEPQDDTGSGFAALVRETAARVLGYVRCVWCDDGPARSE